MGEGQSHLLGLNGKSIDPQTLYFPRRWSHLLKVASADREMKS
jgi:hypothetical protein